jgi:hypothetical protein
MHWSNKPIRCLKSVCLLSGCQTSSDIRNTGDATWRTNRPDADLFGMWPRPAQRWARRLVSAGFPLSRRAHPGLRSCRPSDGDRRDACFLSSPRLRCDRKRNRLFSPFSRQRDQLSSSGPRSQLSPAAAGRLICSRCSDALRYSRDSLGGNTVSPTLTKGAGRQSKTAIQEARPRFSEKNFRKFGRHFPRFENRRCTMAGPIGTGRGARAAKLKEKGLVEV